MQIRIGRRHTRENPRTIHSRNSHPKSPAGAPIKGWYPHSSTSIRHRKGTWGEHQAQVKQIQDLTPTPATSTIDAVSNNRSHKQCGNCGGTHAPRKCLAYGTTCSWCHKQNHWRQVCRSGSSGIANTGGGQAAHAKASTKPTKRHGWSPRCPGHRRQAIHTVTDDSDDDIASGLECLEFSSIEKNSGDNRDKFYASLDIQYKRPASLRVKVDTGAQGNILPLCIFHRMFPEKLAPNGYPAEGTTKKRQTILQACNGTTIKQLGVVTLSCKHKDTEWHSSDFFVTESEGPAILGLLSSRQLRLVTIHCMVQTATTPATQPIHDAMDLKRLYPDRFNGIGDFEGELHITLREDAQPVVQPPWKYPIQLLKEIRTGENGGPWSSHLHHRASRLGQRTCLQQKGQRRSTSLSWPEITEPVHQEDAPQWRRSPIASAAPRCSASWMQSMATGQSSSMKSHRSSWPSTAPSDTSGSRGFPSDWTSYRMHSSSAWIRSSVSAQAPSGSPTTSSFTARMTRTMTEISTTLWKLPRNVDLFSMLQNVSSRHCRSSSLEWFTTLMACTLTWRSALKSKRSPLQRMSQKFSSFSA